MRRQGVSAQANGSAAPVKRARASGRSQNYIPPEAQHALEQAQKAQKTMVLN